MVQPESRAGGRADPGRRAGLRKSSAASAEEAAARALTLQFLGFMGWGRSHGETMEAWRTKCPRMPIWENAVREGLVRIENGGTMRSSRIVLTAKGVAHLQSSRI